MFSCEGNSNRFLDLILGQKFTYYSKKNIDRYKNFYEKEIKNVREFLIALKIGIIHYRECSAEGDPIVFRLAVHYYDDLADLFYNSVFHLVVGEHESKVMQAISKKVEQSLETNHFHGEDHGSLGNYLEKILKKSKLIMLYGFPFRKEIMKKSVPMFKFLSSVRSHSIQYAKSTIENPIDLIKKFTTFSI